jgi:hypothetical protein
VKFGTNASGFLLVLQTLGGSLPDFEDAGSRCQLLQNNWRLRRKPAKFGRLQTSPMCRYCAIDAMPAALAPE